MECLVRPDQEANTVDPLLVEPWPGATHPTQTGESWPTGLGNPGDG